MEGISLPSSYTPIIQDNQVVGIDTGSESIPISALNSDAQRILAERYRDGMCYQEPSNYSSHPTLPGSIPTVPGGDRQRQHAPINWGNRAQVFMRGVELNGKTPQEGVRTMQTFMHQLGMPIGYRGCPDGIDGKAGGRTDAAMRQLESAMTSHADALREAGLPTNRSELMAAVLAGTLDVARFQQITGIGVND